MAQNNVDITTFTFAFRYTYIPYIGIAFFGIISNALLLIAFIKDPLKCFRNSGTYLVINLSVSDLLTSLFDFPAHLHAVVIELVWIFELFGLTFGTVSLLSIASISIDRFLLVAYPLKHRYFFTGKVILLWLSSIWLSSITFPILGLFYGHKMNIMLVVYSFSISVILLSVVIYAITYSTLKKHLKNIAQQNSTESHAQEKKILKEKNFLKTIVLIACIAFACFVPSMIYLQPNNYLHFSKDNLTAVIVHDVLQLILFINFAINPLIYVLRLPNYR